MRSMSTSQNQRPDTGVSRVMQPSATPRASSCFRRVAWIALIALLAPAVFAQEPWEVMDLGTLGGSRTTPAHVDAAGCVVGTGETTLPGPYGPSQHAFVWLPTPQLGLPAGINDLGTLGGDESRGTSSNLVGTVVGIAQTGQPAPLLMETLAFTWRDGVMTALELGIPSFTVSEANAARERCQVILRGAVNGAR